MSWRQIQWRECINWNAADARHTRETCPTRAPVENTSDPPALALELAQVGAVMRARTKMPAYLPAFSKLRCSFSIIWSMLKLEGRWLGGYSLNEARNCAVTAGAAMKIPAPSDISQS